MAAHPFAERFLRLGVSAALLYFVLRSIDLVALWDRVRGMNPAWIVLALIAYAAQLMIGVWRRNRLLRARHIEVDPRKLTESIQVRVNGGRWVWLASAAEVRAAILVIAMPDFVGHRFARCTGRG